MFSPQGKKKKKAKGEKICLGNYIFACCVCLSVVLGDGQHSLIPSSLVLVTLHQLDVLDLQSHGVFILESSLCFSQHLKNKQTDI